MLGINSGTSADGLDLALVRIRRDRRGISCRFLHGCRRSYPASLRSSVRRFTADRKASVESMLALDAQLGLFTGVKAAAFIRQLLSEGYRVDAIGSHGQTVRHHPGKLMLDRRRQTMTLQLGAAERIAAACGRPVVADFRQADIALGGEGAPITVAAMARLFGDRKKSRLIVNIGGIANYFFLPAGGDWSEIQASDCGPGNVLSDEFAERLFGLRYDKNGQLARKGTVSPTLLSRAAQRIERIRLGRQSLSREEFANDLAPWFLSTAKRKKLSKHDTLATASALTPVCIAAATQRLLPRKSKERMLGIEKLYLTGGGARNRFFVRELMQRLQPTPMAIIDELGVPGGLVEATAFAVLGEAALRQEALPTGFSGKQQNRMPISGRIVQPPRREQE